MQSSSPYRLVYFGIRGRAEAIRLLFEATGTPYLNEEPENWGQMKKEMVFGQVPYFEHGDLKLNQSMAILRYVAKETGTYGANNKEAAIIDMLIDGEEEWRNRYTGVIYSRPPFSDFMNDKKEYCTNYLPTQFAIFEKLLGTKTYFVGSGLTCVDCVLFEMIDISVRMATAECLKDFPNLKRFWENFQQLPRIADYIKNRRSLRINGNGKGQ